MKFDIRKFDPCTEALNYYKDFDSFEDAWAACHRGDWMLWIAYKLNIDNRKLTLAKGLCAKTVIHLMKNKRSIEAVEAAINYGNNIIDKKELDAAYAAAYAAYADAAAAADAADDARKKNRQETANICRKILTEEIFKKIKTYGKQSN